MLKKILLAVGGAVVLLVVVLIVNAARLSPDVDAVEAAPTLLFDSDAGVERFADAIRIPTISFETVEETDTAHFLALHDHFEQAYPLTHGSLTRELVGDLSLLYSWAGSDPSLESVVLMGHLDVSGRRMAKR